MKVVYVLHAIRQNYSVDIATGDWVCSPTGYDILIGQLVKKELKHGGLQEGKIIYHVLIDDKIFFFEEYFETYEEAERKKMEYLK